MKPLVQGCQRDESKHNLVSLFYEGIGEQRPFIQFRLPFQKKVFPTCTKDKFEEIIFVVEFEFENCRLKINDLFRAILKHLTSILPISKLSVMVAQIFA